MFYVDNRNISLIDPSQANCEELLSLKTVLVLSLLTRSSILFGLQKVFSYRHVLQIFLIFDIFSEK